MTGNAGLAFVICAARDVWVLPSKGRYIAVRCCSLIKIDTANLVVDTFVEKHSQTPPICSTGIPGTFVYLRRKICQSSRFACERFARREIRSHVLSHVNHCSSTSSSRNTYEIGQMYMSFRIEQDVIWLDVSMYDALFMDIS